MKAIFLEFHTLPDGSIDEAGLLTTKMEISRLAKLCRTVLSITESANKHIDHKGTVKSRKLTTAERKQISDIRQEVRNSLEGTYGVTEKTKKRKKIVKF